MSKWLGAVEWDAAELAAKHPLAYKNANKQAVLEKCYPQGTPYKGDILIARWNELGLPPWAFKWDKEPTLELNTGFFDYTAETERTHWYPNFADPDLFGFWDSDMLAQDELQVLEHPILVAIRKEMLARDLPTGTTHYDTVTPFFLRGVERHLDMDVRGLYGNDFYRAPVQKCLDAATKLDPPTISNIYAFPAVACGSGHYTIADITRLMRAAYTAFRGCKELSLTDECVLHVGYWGCGAFGGNRVMMTGLQILAAHLAEVDKVVFHTGGNTDPYLDGYEVYAQFDETVERSANDAILYLLSLDLEWGESDGN